MRKNLEKFIGLYHMDKTLRFELKPMGKTLENINNNGFIENDNHRADSYKKVKKLIDRYHKYYIESVLGDFKLNSIQLEAYYNLYTQQSKTEKEIKEFEAIQDKLRKSIAEALKKDDRFKRIDKKELINEDLNVVLENDDERILIDNTILIVGIIYNMCKVSFVKETAEDGLNKINLKEIKKAEAKANKAMVEL